MKLLEASFSGAVFIIAVMIIRAVALDNLPKKTFLVLWEMVLLRLMIPFTIPSIFNIYTLINRSVSTPAPFKAGTGNTTSIISQKHFIIVQDMEQLPANSPSISIWFIVWCAGMIFFFTIYDSQTNSAKDIIVNKKDAISIIHESANILYYEDGAPYIHDILTNNTDKTIIKTQYCMLAYDESGSPLKLYWNFLDSSAESSFENIVQSEENILSDQTEEYRGGWSLYDGEVMRGFPKIGNGEANQVAYALLCLKQVVFEDSTVWDNPNYENWFKSYAGKETTVDELQNYYPNEYKIESD